jgi:hypothetical protein
MWGDVQMDAATCAKITWMISGSFSGDSNELANVRRALAEAIFNTDGKGFPKPSDPPERVLDSKEWTGCKNAALEAESELSDDDSIKNQIKFILFVPNGSDDKPNTKSPDLKISWPQTSEFAYQAGPVIDGSNRKIHLLSYRRIDQERALSEPGLGSEGLYPIELRNSLSPKTSSRPPQVNASGMAIGLFVLSMAIGIASMAWIYDVTKLIRTNVNLILSKTTVEIDSVTKEIKSIAIVNENKKLTQSELDNSTNNINKNCLAAQCLEEEEKQLGEKTKRLEKERQCIEKINEQLQKGSSTIQDKKQCSIVLSPAGNIGETHRVIKFFREKSFHDSTFSLFIPFLLSQIAIFLLVIAAGYAIKGRPLGAFITASNRISLSGVQQILWLILLFGGITILSIFNIALLADYARTAVQYGKLSTDSGWLQFFPNMEIELWAAIGITVLASPLISKKIVNKRDSTDGNFETQEVRQDKNDAAGQSFSNHEANWTDIFTDEKHENSNNVDISRLQHLVITGLLLGGYFILLAEYVSNINASAIFFALVTGQSVFTDMPPIDFTFIGLMAISHAGYLAFKALPQKPNL